MDVVSVSCLDTDCYSLGYEGRVGTKWVKSRLGREGGKGVEKAGPT